MDVQENILRSIAKDRGWSLQPDGEIWRESLSGRKKERPVFEEIIQYIKNNPGKVKYYLFRAIDRFTRRGTLDYETMQQILAKYGVELIDSFGIIQPARNTLSDLDSEYEWSIYRPSKIAELVTANMAREEVTTMLTRTIGQEIRLTRQGFKVRSAVDGFLNKQVFVDGKRKVIQVPDPERAKFITEIFRLRAAGTHTDHEIVDIINAMGFRTKLKHHWDQNREKVIGTRGGIPLTVKQLQVIVRRPIYCGIVCELWTKHLPIKAQYDGLVSIEVFNQANRGETYVKQDGENLQILHDFKNGNMRKKKNHHNPLFPYKNVVLCPLCPTDKTFTGSVAKGKSGKGFPQYHCSRKGHKYFGVSKKEFEKNVEHYVRSIKFKPEYLDGFKATLLNKYSEREKEIMRISADIHLNISDLKAEQAAKLQALVSSKSPVVREKLEQEIESLETQIKGAGSESAKIEVTESDIKQFIEWAKYLMEHLSELLLNPDNPWLQETLFGLVFEKLPTYEEILNGTPKLSLIFSLSSDFSPLKGELGCLEGFEPSLHPPQG